MDVNGYVGAVAPALEARGFAPLRDLPPDLAAALVLAVGREERWGRLVLCVPPPDAANDPERREWLATAVMAYCRELARPQVDRPVWGVLAFLFSQGVADADLPPIRALRREDPHRRWGVVPWAVDLKVELVDRHRGFPQVSDEVQVALATWPGVRRGPAPEFRRGPVRNLVRLVQDWRRGEFGPVPATRLILAWTVAYYLWSVLNDPAGPGLLAGPSHTALVAWGANLTPLTLGGEGWRLLAAIFLHGGLWHLGLNMWALWHLGRHVELLYGSRPMAFIYLMAGLSGSIASAALRLTPVISVGASGAVFGLLGAVAYAQRASSARRIDWGSIFTPLAATFLYGLFLRIDHLGHIGGLAGGFAAAWLIGATGQRRRWRRWAVGLTLALAGALVAGVVPLPHLGAGPGP